MNWEQVNAWRMAKHHLTQPVSREQRFEVVQAIGGLHAQLMSSAELSLAARVHDLQPDDVANDLWEARQLVKLWAMRGTLHLLTKADYPLMVAALSTRRNFEKKSWEKYFGVSVKELYAIIEAAQVVLTDEGLTREALADAIAAQSAIPDLREKLLSSWGAVLKPIAAQGYLCFGPNRGQNVSFVSPEKWLGAWETVDETEALTVILRRFLAAYGPSTPDLFMRWFALEARDAKRLFKLLADELAEVSLDGKTFWLLRADIDALDAAQATGMLRLLPYFDPYTVSLSRLADTLMDTTYKARVYRGQGWISPVILLDGAIVGVWEHEQKRTSLQISVELFTPPNDRLRQQIEAEGQRIAAFLGASSLEIAYQKAKWR